MKKKLLVTAITLATAGVVQASSFLQQDPVEAVYDEDTAYDNPIFLLNTANQLTANDSGKGNIGIVFNAFGQKLAIAAGGDPTPFQLEGSAPGAYGFGSLNGTAGFVMKNFSTISDTLDLFWAGDLGFGAIGIQASYGAGTDKDLNTPTVTSNWDAAPVIEIDSDGNGSFDNGTDLWDLDVSENLDDAVSSFAQINAGIKFNDLPIEGSIALTLPNFSSTNSLAYVDTFSQDASGGSAATATQRYTYSESDAADRTGGLNIAVAGRYKVNNNLRILTNVFSFKDEVTSSSNSVITDYQDTDNDGTAETNETTTQSYEVVDDTGNTFASIGLEYEMFAGASSIQVFSALNYSKENDTTEQSTTEERVVDNVADTTTTTTYTNGNEPSLIERSETTFQIPLSIQAQYMASEKWVWRVGATAILAEHISITESNTDYELNGTNDGWDVQDVNVTTKSRNLSIVNDIQNIEIGFSYSPVKNVTFDAIFDKALVEDGPFTAANGLITNGSLAVTIKY